MAGPRYKDISGERFGQLAVVAHAGTDTSGGSQWRCRCACGAELVTAARTLRSGMVKACRTCALAERSSDLMGQRFGMLLVLSVARRRDGRAWRCRCDCGRETTVPTGKLSSGTTASCGCRGQHGMTGTPTWNSWAAMWERCTRAAHPAFPRYGGRGIAVCQQWKDFRNFLADMGERPDGKTLDRFPNKDGNYEPGNCRWATPREQSLNTALNHHNSALGTTMTVVEWAERSGLKKSTIRERLRHGWTPDEAVSSPAQPRRKR